ncbi:DUF2628 domain-containing protein [Pediococcus ethanolidurans]|uniref:DUF2628 domain-containing protein n=1 Tax=Pediococcus ethanolidurans TaxID=319653 RepID=UPI001C1EB8FB|nr:DUF2628 domain-containing protein [Pediococcus ethanolidurans]MBU7562636.1 DUF2628 domain-containing protein [Pediococcus ethanolidurans]MCV3320780.1 DUF2628 domain-containing protein [Pediococcus ethanolidurans]
MIINLSNPVTKQVKQAKVGFSWTTFFWGFWPALFRGDWKWFAILIAIDIVTGAFTLGIGTGIANIIFAFIYNKLYINDLLNAGWKPADKNSEQILINNGFIAANN